MLNREPPFSKKYKDIGYNEFLKLTSSQNENGLKYSGDLVSNRSTLVKDLLNFMFITDRERRPSIDAVLEHLG